MHSLGEKYEGFLSPSFQIQIGSFQIDSSIIPVSSLQVQVSAENKAGACSFTINAMYDYENKKWAQGLLDQVDVGKPVEVEAGYVTTRKRIFLGYVDRFTINYSAQEGPQLQVSAMDGMGLLMSNQEKQDFGERKAADVVKLLVGEAKTEGVIESSTVDSLPDFEGQFVKEKNCSNYEFLCQIAEMCFMNFCVIDGEMLFSNLMSNTTTLLELTMGVDMIEFSKTIAFSRQSVGSVTVISTGTKDKQEVRGEAKTPSRFGSESGKTAAEKWAALAGSNRDMVFNFLKSADECRTVAQNVLDRMALGFITASGRCIGVPELMPGRYIEISGLDTETDGSYFVTGVTHSFSSAGYFTQFEVKGFRSK